MTWTIWIPLVLTALVLWAVIAHWIVDNPRQSVGAGLLWRTIELYSAFVHRLRVTGGEHVHQSWFPGPLIVVSNHTAGIDPLLIIAACPFEVRWMMTADMRAPALEWLWKYANIIFVDRVGSDVSGAREAIRHVKSGGVLGIFPEGGIERPPRHILPFHGGVGFIVRRTKAPVLPVVITGTPPADTAWGSLRRRSRSRLAFMPPIDYSTTGLSADEIAADLRRRYVEWTGWPPVEERD